MVAAILPRTINHKKQAQHNYDLLNKIDKNTFKDWAITIAFYMALHYVSAHAIQQGWDLQPHPKDQFSPHQKRIRYVKKYLPTKFTKYKRLFDECINARYDPLYFSKFSGDVERLINIAFEFKSIV